MMQIECVRDLAPSAGLFGPGDISRLAAAYEAALTIAGDEGSPFAGICDDDLRQRVAHLVLVAARQGVRDVDQLKAYALRTLRPSRDLRLVPGTGRDHRSKDASASGPGRSVGSKVPAQPARGGLEGLEWRRLETV